MAPSRPASSSCLGVKNGFVTVTPFHVKTSCKSCKEETASCFRGRERESPSPIYRADDRSPDPLRRTGMRPEKCFRLRWKSVTWLNGHNYALLVTDGTTAAARRVIPMTPRVRLVLEARSDAAGNKEGLLQRCSKRTASFASDPAFSCQVQIDIATAAVVASRLVWQFR